MPSGLRLPITGSRHVRTSKAPGAASGYWSVADELHKEGLDQCRLGLPCASSFGPEIVALYAPASAKLDRDPASVGDRLDNEESVLNGTVAGVPDCPQRRAQRSGLAAGESIACQQAAVEWVRRRILVFADGDGSYVPTPEGLGWSGQQRARRIKRKVFFQPIEHPVATDSCERTWDIFAVET